MTLNNGHKDTATMTLTDFLLARIAEDEAVARAAMVVHRERVEYLGDGKWGRKYFEAVPAGEVSRSVLVYVAPGPSSPGQSWTDNPGSEHFAHFNPARILAECEAKREIVRRARRERGRFEQTGGNLGNPIEAVVAWETAVRTLAAAYSDHPDYRNEWKP